MPRFALQIDLKKNKLLHCTGYPESEPREAGAQVRAALRRDVGPRTFFVRGIFHGMGGAEGLCRRLETLEHELDVPGWAGRLRGDFTVVIWNHDTAEITAISDRMGAHRLMVHRAPGGVVTLTNRLTDQIKLQASPRLSDMGVYTLMSFAYPLDPYTILADTWACTVGDLARVTADDVKLQSYYEPVLEVMENFATVDEATAELDRTLTQVITENLSDDRLPMLMLSGGIDSVVLLDYLSRLAPGRVNSFTFAMEGMKGDELGPARVAAKHYGTRHHQLVIPRADIERNTRRAMMESATTTYGGFVHVALADWFGGFGEPLTVFRGEDHRLHTPTLDLPALVGVYAHRFGLHRSPLGRRLWGARRAAAVWPFRKGRNYLRFILDRTELTDGLRTYAMKNLLRYTSPLDTPIPAEILDRFDHLDRCTSLEQLYRAVAALGVRLQHTENMWIGQVSTETANSNAVMPYFLPELVRACNRVPIGMGLRPTFAPGRTGSPIPVAAKYVLRKLVAGRAPEALLFRRKAVAPAVDLQYAEAGARTLFPVIRDWSPLLLEQLSGDTRRIAEHTVQRFLEGGLDHTWPMRFGTGSQLFHLAGMARLCQDPSVDLEAAMDDLEPWRE